MIGDNGFGACSKNRGKLWGRVHKNELVITLHDDGLLGRLLQMILGEKLQLMREFDRLDVGIVKEDRDANGELAPSHFAYFKRCMLNNCAERKSPLAKQQLRKGWQTSGRHFKALVQLEHDLLNEV